MANKTRGGKDLAAPAQKYAGQVKIEGGPVPIQRWRKPFDMNDHHGPSNADMDLRGETPSSPTGKSKGRRS